MVIQPNRFTLNELADVFKSAEIKTQDAYESVRAIIVKLDEQAFKSSKIDKRGEFVIMCGLTP
jgi:hypothetical protein